MHIVGTAGHVDHGKSALVAALTGTNPDRLAEERERGMTLDLGFAHLKFEDGVEGGIVDVPGHERFLHNMLAGAAGMELLLLVVDANEGVRAQTLEHLAILRFLNVHRIIVVVTKIDLVEPERRDALCSRIAGQLQGTIAKDAPFIAVSAKRGEGIAELKTMLHRELAQMPPRNADAPVYLPIDRVFTLAGLGTVVTGTLMQGSIAAGDALRIEPGGMQAHARSVGVFGSVRKRVEAGSRVALNLSGVDRHAVARGQAIVGAEFSAGRSFPVRFTPLREALPLLRRRTPVRAYVGSAEVLGTLVAEAQPQDESEVRAQLHLRKPVVAFGGVRFVLRRPSPMTLLGGGYVEGAERGADSVAEDPGVGAVRRVFAERGSEAVESSTIAALANLREGATFTALNRLIDSGEAIRLAKPRAYMDGAGARAILSRALAHLEESQRAEPWAMGVTSIALSRVLGLPEQLLVRVVQHFIEEGRLVNRAGYYATAEHQAKLTPEQRIFFDNLVPPDEGQPFLPIPFAGVASAVKLSRLTGISKAFDTLLARGTLVKVDDELYRGSQIGRITARVEAYLKEHERMTAADFRDLLGTTRKYAVPLLEWLDSRGVTIRSGDYRTLRNREGP